MQAVDDGLTQRRKGGGLCAFDHKPYQIDRVGAGKGAYMERNRPPQPLGSSGLLIEVLAAALLAFRPYPVRRHIGVG